MDFGLYTVLVSLWMFKGEKPAKIFVSGEKNEQGINPSFTRGCQKKKNF